MAINVDNFIFASDYPVDKIVWIRSGELTTDEYGGWDEITINHGINATLFVKGVVSFDNWASVYPIGMTKYSSGGQTMEIYSQIISNSTQIKFSGAKEGANRVTAKYRMWGVVNENETSVTEFSATVGQSSNRLLLSTDCTYPKLVSEGYITTGDTFDHNTGKIPYCDIWATKDNTNWFNWSSDIGNTFGKADGYGEYIKITKNQIITTRNTDYPKKFYYRIYA